MLTIHKPSAVKGDMGGFLDKAAKEPQYVERKGRIFVVTLADLSPSMPLRPTGFFSDAYGDAEREKREHAAFKATKFQAER